MKPSTIVAVAAAYVVYRMTQSTQTDFAGAMIGEIYQGSTTIMKAVTGWSNNLVPSQYRAAIAEAEARNDLPSGLLARLLWQESHFRDDIITGATRSKVGAVGIAQFMPATAAEMGVNPLDPFASIAAAGAYLARIRSYVGGGIAEMLAAYNWGMGNVRNRGLTSAPSETVTYYTTIMRDVGVA